MTRSALPRVAAMACLFTVLVLPSRLAHATEVSVQDGTFAPSDWGVSVFWEQGLSGIITVEQETSGGNPGEYRSVDVLLSPAKLNDWGRYNRVHAFHNYIPRVYDPATEGGVYSIDFSEDARLYAGYLEGQGGGPAIRQNGVVYQGGSFTIPGATWFRHSLTDLTEDDWYDPRNPTAHPDFSETGSPIEIGFWSGNSGTSDDPYHSLAGIDNWSFVIRTSAPVPVEPSSWGCVKALYRR